MTRLIWLSPLFNRCHVVCLILKNVYDQVIAIAYLEGYQVTKEFYKTLPRKFSVGHKEHAVWKKVDSFC